MRLEPGEWSEAAEPPAPQGFKCPSCGVGLPGEALAGGQRLARCRQCGQLARRAVRRGWPTTEYEAGSTRYDWGGAVYEVENELRLEPAISYPYPALQCSYCEHVNQDRPTTRPEGAMQGCANCGADLKKPCLNCDAPLYVLDHFCTRCRTDQEKLKYEVEAMYWQHYNEGKRLARLGRWSDAERELALFFNPPPTTQGEDARQARQLYVRSIAPYDGGEGLELYNEAIEQLRQAHQFHKRQAERRKLIYVGLGGLGLALVGILSSVTFGSWWAIFVIVPVVGLVLGLLVLFLIANLGLG